jgi:hypothetical protein
MVTVTLPLAFGAGALVIGALHSGKVLGSFRRVRQPTMPVSPAALPPQVWELARRAGTPRAAPPRIAELRESGVLAVDGGSQARFVARRASLVSRTGFLWQAEVDGGGEVRTLVDGLLDGCAIGDPSMPEPAARTEAAYKREATRYLAELVWNPDAIVFNRELTWRAIAPDELSVAVGNGRRRTEVRFFLDENGDVCRVESDDRPRGVGGDLVPTAWRAVYSRYRVVGGRRVPTYGRAAWIIDGAEMIYWRGHIESWAAVY